MHFYTKKINETLDALSSSIEGLSESEVIPRIKKFGLNILPEKREKNIFEIFLFQFKSPIIYILLVATLLAFSIQEFTDGFFILAVLFINAFIGTYQEYSASTKAKILQNLIKSEAVVIREANAQKIDSANVVPGDILVLESGTKVCADARLIESKQLAINESLLTGESKDVNKEADFVSEQENLHIADRKNMVYAGTFVSRGKALAVVTSTGKESEAGKIAVVLSEKSKAKIPLIEKMEKLSLSISYVVGAVSLLILFVGIFLKGMAFYDIILFCVALAVSAIPEGLPVAITVSLTSASLLMSKKNVIIRKLAAIEGLGACTLIASDKTGTLTKNRLSVEYFVSHRNTYSTGMRHDDIVYLASILCNEMHFEKKEDKYIFLGDQVDIALARYAMEADESYMDTFRTYKKIDEIPYESQNRFSATMVEKEGIIFQFSKGSPETILDHCALSEEDKKDILKGVDEWTAKGYRTIALAYKESLEESEINLKNFNYLGFVAMIDPVREGVLESVKKAQKAGIKVMMITGDHPNTAFSIARDLCIATDKNQVMNDKELNEWENKGAPEKEIENKTVFSRVTPSQKMKIVTAFRALDHYVAVTGDGVNDAPALKHANIGVSMGKSGTDIARSSSDLILTDDNFTSIVNGIEEGRRAHDNIRKVVYLLVSTGFAEIVLVLLSFLLALPVPLLPVQLLWLNLVTNGIQHVMLGLEKAEPGILDRKPRPPKEPIFNYVMIRRIITGGLYIGICSFFIFYFLLQGGEDEFSARNITLLLMVLFENIHVFNSRSESNYLHKIKYKGSIGLISIVAFTQLFHVASMNFPFMQKVLHIEPVSFDIWIFLVIIALGLAIVMEIDKRFMLKN